MEHFIFNPSNKSEGLYHIPNMPEISDQRCQQYNSGRFNGCQHSSCACELDDIRYQKELSLAISQSIPVENEEETIRLIWDSKGLGFTTPNLKPGEIYQLDCKVKVKKACRKKCTCKTLLCNDYDAAVVSPKDKAPESCPTIKDCKHYEPRHCLLNGCKLKEQPKQLPNDIGEKITSILRDVELGKHSGDWAFNQILPFVSLPTESSEESIQCPYCDGDGFTAEHSDHSPDEPCNGCPIQMQCEYCYATGRITTKLMKGHIESRNRPQPDDNLLF